MERPLATTGSLSGDWHLLGVADPEQPIPQHRMDLRLEEAETHFRAAVLNRVTGEEMPLAHAHWNGSELRLQMFAPPDRQQAEMPWLVMTRIGSRFEGRWQTQDGGPMGPQLKLIPWAA